LPRALAGACNLAAALFGTGRDTEALGWAEQGLLLGDHPLGRGLAAAILAQLGRIDEARRRLAVLPALRLSDVRRFLPEQLVERALEGLRLAGMTE
jgi:hypothetical protein